MHKGGSFGRRTSVRDRYDVDLPVFVNGLDYQDKDQVDKLLMHVGAMQVIIAPDMCSQLQGRACVAHLTSSMAGLPGQGRVSWRAAIYDDTGA